MIMLSLVLGIEAKYCNPQIAKKSNEYNSLNSKKVFPPIFKVSRDTIHLNIEGRLSRALLIHDKYYCFYQVRDPRSTLPIKNFYIIDKSGRIEKKIEVPEEIHNDTYFKLYYWRDRIIINTESSKSTYCLDLEKSEFVKNPQIIVVPIYEDENYQITSSCHGEFGSEILFRNKHTGNTNTVNSGCPIVVNNLGTSYILNTNGVPYNYIEEINDPTSTITRNDFTYNNLDDHFYIPTSFVTNGVLYHVNNSLHDDFSLTNKERVTVTKDSVKIGIIKGGQFKPIYTFKDKFHIELEQQLSPRYQICTFHTEDRITIGFKKDIPPYMEAKYGFIEIADNEVKIHYFMSKRAG